MLLGSQTALGQTGVDDDRVSLPAGPGSLEGVGDDVEIDPNMGIPSRSSCRAAFRALRPTFLAMLGTLYNSRSKSGSEICGSSISSGTST